MALVPYGFKCVNEKCEKYSEEYIDVLDRDGEIESKCPLCDKMAQRVYSLQAVTVDFKPGFDVGLGEWIDTKRQREEICSREGIRRIKC